ncbi:uncharacterized protein LOC111383711 [Olea europaea var. sylvestris]|uniref:uncharacterized protein LOC111383711 n=1 Tax=Olea europaea var. sylvestris TaxID=158386 RepID=UPI000C1D6436|nr:uncharacterized protein LOC111383711 [Olea europaea var. sylvestris]
MTGIVVLMDCTYNHLKCMIYSVMKVSASTQRVKIQYRVKKNLPLMEISDNISLTFYLELKRKDKDRASFPLCVNVTTFCEAVTDNSMTSAQKLPSMEEIAIDVYNSMSKVGKTTNEGGSDIISMVTMDGISKEKVFRNKTLVKRKLQDLVELIYSRLSMSYEKVWRSKKKALELVRGDPTESYEKLPEYLYIIEQTNPGSVTKIETYQDNKFKYLFMALGASIQGWKYCRPVIVIYATFLKGNYGGTLFTACTQDANNNIFILAFGVGDLEINDSWEWFLSMLKEASGEREGLCIISDGHASIKNAIHKVYENAMHDLCSYHLLKNLKSSFGGKKGGKNIVEHFNRAVRVYSKIDFEFHMKQLDEINTGIRSHLVCSYC